MTASTAALAPPRRSAFREFIGSVTTILVKELRSRMRGRRAFILLTVYLALLALIAYGVYLIAAPSARNAFGGFTAQVNTSAIIGQSIFIVLSIFQLILICFIAPAATSGQISLEREKQTLDLLISTPMRPAAIVIGKLAAALAYVVLMIVAAIPITAIVLMYGGASIADIARQQLVLLATAVVLGAIGLFYSSLLKRTQAATVLTFITVLVMTLGTGAVFGFWTALANQTDTGFGIGRPRVAPEQLLYINPGVAMLDVIAGTDSGAATGITTFLDQLRGGTGFQGVEPDFAAPIGVPADGAEGEVICRGDTCVGVDPAVPVPGQLAAPQAGYWWPRIGLSFLGVAALLTLASMRLVRPAGMRGVFRRRRGAPATAAAATESADQGTIEELREPES